MKSLCHKQAKKTKEYEKNYYFSDFPFLFSKSRPMHLSQNEFEDYEWTPVCFNWLWAKWEKHIHCAAALHMNRFLCEFHATNPP